ncbi:MAG: arabinogalactan endo-1,4-beta-galactosidase, partial [Oscillospiraceae bacterium]|nr:arabinogalactan endo-1,4-beta-galactosidase [Oscillospiraceae bacterium]
NCDAAAAAELGRRAAQAGLKLIVDFHYSDFWADPGKQRAPKAWEGLSAGEKAEALYAYTKDSLRRILEAGGEVDVVQLGNEINGGLCGESDWACVGLLLDAGSRAVRELCPGARIALHFTDPQREGAYRRYAETLEELGADYDLFASSYYPCWHGTLDELTAALSEAAAASGRQVMVMETAYPYTEADSDFFANTLGADAGEYRPFPYTVEGQAAAVRSVLDAVRRTEGGAGVCCWEGAWIAAGGASYEENRAKWERFGCGWAAGAAGEYDPDAADAPGGCAVDNQAFFGPDGRALESLKLFGEFQNGV